MRPDDLSSAIRQAREAQQAGSLSFLDALLSSTGIGAVAACEALEASTGIKALLDGAKAEPVFDRLDASLAGSIGGVAVRIDGEESVFLAMADPWGQGALRRAASALGFTPRLAAVSAKQLRAWLSQDTQSRHDQGGASSGSVTGPVEGVAVAFVENAIIDAFRSGASDIHFERERVGLRTRLRKDGVLVPLDRLDDPDRADEVISRIKVLAQLDITERRIPQDGRFRFSGPRGSFDLRVSIMPSVHGEDAVLRLLDKANMRSVDTATTLARLGFSPEGARRIRDLGTLPHGMLLVTGPTGSGKTTTVYALLSEVDNGLEKIVTIEDPVEYELAGVLQIPVNERKGLTFAKGLRSILRHDPDRILVGEIRDAETAEIAIQSSLTGHQVLTTVHANGLLDVVGRFRHFGLDMFSFMGALNGVVVQRLLRKVCPHCCIPAMVREEDDAWLHAALGGSVETVAAGPGCDHCEGAGYRGRTVVAEVHEIDDSFRDLVTTGRPLSALREHMVASGVASLASQGARLVRDRITTMEEIRRVVGRQTAM